MRLTTSVGGEHHVTIPAHDPLKLGTLNSILRGISNHAKLSKEELVGKLFSKRR